MKSAMKDLERMVLGGPGDSFSIDNFYKVYGYACIYKTAVSKVKEIQRTRNLKVVKVDEGIYHISGDIFQIQMIYTAKLSKENIFWLRNLTNDLQAKEDARNLLDRYNERPQENLYQSVMDVIVKAR